MCIISQEKFGMQGRLLLFQEHPFECQSNYDALASLRCNFDMQDLRRVLPEDWDRAVTRVKAISSESLCVGLSIRASRIGARCSCGA